MSFLEKLKVFFHREEKIEDRVFNEIEDAISNSERCKFCENILQFPIAILPCGHLYDSKCIIEQWNQSVCPECQNPTTRFEIVQSNQTVCSWGWGVTPPHNPHSAGSPSSPVQSKQASSPVQSKQTSSPVNQAPSPVSNRVTSPVVSNVNARKSLIQTTIENRIWKLTQHFWTIPESKRVVTSRTYYSIVLDYLEAYVPRDLYQEAKSLKAKNLSDLLEQNQNVGECIMYAMMLFLAMDYCSQDIRRSNDTSTRQLFKRLFNEQLFDLWKTNINYLTSDKLLRNWVGSRGAP